MKHGRRQAFERRLVSLSQWAMWRAATGHCHDRLYPHYLIYALLLFVRIPVQVVRNLLVVPLMGFAALWA